MQVDRVLMLSWNARRVGVNLTSGGQDAEVQLKSQLDEVEKHY